MLHRLLAIERARELRRGAQDDQLARVATRPPIPARASTFDHALTIRYAFPDDAGAIARLATLDSAEPPVLPALVAEVAGELRAALSLADGVVVADPFHASAGIVELLRARARQLAGSRVYAEPPARRRAALLSVIARRLQTRS